MSKTLEAWRFGDPAEVVERLELQANAAAARESAKAIEQAQRQSTRERMRELVFRKQQGAR
jgi:hypothetical protein